MPAHADGLALLAIGTGPADQADCQPCAPSREIGIAVRARHGRRHSAEPCSRFMAVARRRRKADDDKGSASHSKANSKFFAASSTAKGDGVDGADFGSMFLAPPMTPRPSPRPRSARLRARFPRPSLPETALDALMSYSRIF